MEFTMNEDVSKILTSFFNRVIVIRVAPNYLDRRTF